MTLITDLPTETLIQIVNNWIVDATALYSLSLMCRRFHTIFVPILLAHHGIPDPATRAVFTIRISPQCSERGRCGAHRRSSAAYRASDALSALRMSFSTTRIQFLSCYFDFPCAESVIELTSTLWRFRALLNRLTQVDRLALLFRETACSHTNFFKPLKRWSTALTAVLNLALQRGCVSLVVRGLKLLSHSDFIVEKRTKLQAVFYSGREILDRFLDTVGDRFGIAATREWRPNPRDCHTAGGHMIDFPRSLKKHRSQLSIRSFHLASMTLLVPPLLRWTISCLRLCPLEELSLEDIHLKGSAWILSFSILSHPRYATTASLKRLVTRRANMEEVPIPELFYFINSFPKLQDVEIGDGAIRDPPPPISHRPPSIGFANLTRLTAPGSLASSLLKHFSLPCLTHITISCLFQHYWENHAINNLHSAFTDAKKALQRLVDPERAELISGGASSPLSTSVDVTIMFVANEIYQSAQLHFTRLTDHLSEVQFGETRWQDSVNHVILVYPQAKLQNHLAYRWAFHSRFIDPARFDLQGFHPLSNLRTITIHPNIGDDDNMAHLATEMIRQARELGGFPLLEKVVVAGASPRTVYSQRPLDDSQI